MSEPIRVVVFNMAGRIYVVCSWMFTGEHGTPDRRAHFETFCESSSVVLNVVDNRDLQTFLTMHPYQ